MYGATGDLDGAVGDVVDEGAVVAHEHYGLAVAGKEVLEPLYALDVEVVGGLVEQEHVGVLQEELGQLDTHAPSARELGSGAVEVFATEAKAHEGLLHLGMVVGTTDELEALVLAGEAVDEFVILLTLVVGALGHLGGHGVEHRLLLADVGKGLLGLFTHGALVGELHHLGKVAY